ncbi:MAG: DUF1631 family protein [Pseudomonadota bacterium]
MDKRRNPRYAINLSALVHPNVGRSWLCMIRDFCEGGMLLVEQDATRRRALPGIRQGETVGIHFSVPATGKDLHFRLEGKIVRVMDSGVGIQFANGIEDDAMTALLNYSNSQPLVSRAAAEPKRAAAPAGRSGNSTLDLQQQPGHIGGITATDARKLIVGIRKEVARVMPEMNSAFFSYMDEELLKLARDAKTNAEQSDYFAAMSTLEKAKKEVGQSFINEVLDQIDHPRDLRKLLEERKNAEQERKQKQASRVKLSLVSTDEFEDWLAVANIISRSERVYEKYLNELQQRMGMLVDSWGHNEANPLGTSVFVHAFDTAIRKVDLAKDIRQKVYSGFEAKSVPLFRKLYIAVTRMLEESKLFPDLDDDFVVPTPSARPAAEKEEKKAPEPEPEPTPEPEAEKAQEPEDADEDLDLRAQIAELRAQLQERSGATPREPAPERNRARAAQPEKRAPRAQGSSAASSPAGKGGRAPARTRRGDLGEALSNIYSTVRDLMGRGGSDEDAEFDFDGVDGVEDVELDEVQQLLSSLQDEVRSRGSSGQRLPIRRRLQESAVAGGRARRIPAQALESLGMVENLVDTIEDDAMLSGSAKDWIRQLELTLDKVATTDQDFLNVENPHRSLEVINQLARLGGSESGGIKRNVDEIVDYINDNFDDNPAVFDEALNKLQPLVERQSRAFTGNVQRTVKASEGQQTLVNAQRAVVDEMDGMLSGRQIPEVLFKLLMPGWRNLLVNTHLRQGQDSSDWKRHVRALEQVVQHLDGTVDPTDKENYLAPEALLAEIEQGLDSIAFEPGQRTPLINSLRRVIVDGEDISAMPLVAVPEDGVATTLGFSEVSAKEAQRQKLREENESDDDWQTWLGRVQHLHVGEWLEIADQNEQQQIAIVAWTNEAHSTFVFVNRRGVKTHELMAEDLATRLQQGQARILEEADIPLTDRASHRMLQNMHNQLTHQATHDELTGLVNRKEFERELTRALGLARRNDLRHLVAYMDLDQFKVINNSAGHEAGDKLLQEIAGLLREKLSDVKAVLARLGGDEFGLLIENCEKDAGVSVVRQLADVIKRHRFEWGKQTYSLTTSVGVVMVDKDMESISTIMGGQMRPVSRPRTRVGTASTFTRQTMQPWSTGATSWSLCPRLTVLSRKTGLFSTARRLPRLRLIRGSMPTMKFC